MLLDMRCKFRRCLAVDQQAVVLLILANGCSGLSSHDPVGRTRIVCHLGQGLLDVFHQPTTGIVRVTALLAGPARLVLLPDRIAQIDGLFVGERPGESARGRANDNTLDNAKPRDSADG